jgi:hypothetical protein
MPHSAVRRLRSLGVAQLADGLVALPADACWTTPWLTTTV